MQVVHDVNKGGFNDTLAISFSTGHYAKQCHAFQAKTSREVSSDWVGVAYRGAKVQYFAHPVCLSVQYLG